MRAGSVRAVSHCRAASARAYLEWMPVRADSSGEQVKIYRRLRFGDLAELSMLDLRTYRDQQAALPLADRHHQVHHARRQVVGAGLEALVVERDDRRFVFFEHFEYARSRGVISVLEIDRAGHAGHGRVGAGRRMPVTMLRSCSFSWT